MMTVKLDERYLIEQLDAAIYHAKRTVTDKHDRAAITMPLFRVRGYLVASAELKTIDSKMKGK